jgi:hypothetical protein
VIKNVDKVDLMLKQLEAAKARMPEDTENLRRMQGLLRRVTRRPPKTPDSRVKGWPQKRFGP